MRKLTKIIVCLLTLVLVLSCTGMTVSAAENKTLSFTTPTKVEVGQSVTVSLNAEVADLVTDGTLVVTYDTGLLSYVGATAGKAWSEKADLSLADYSKAAEGTVTVSFAAVDAAAKGSIVELEFTARKAGTARLTVDGEKSELTGAGSRDLSAKASFTVAEKTLPTYTVTFVDGMTGETLGTDTVTSGEAAVAPAVANHDGCYFLGWDKDFSKVTENMTVTALFCTGEGDCPSAAFTDVIYGMWYHESIDYAITAGYMQGTSATTFEPDFTTNRATAVTVLYRMAGSPATTGTKMPFTDVAEGQWYYDAVLWACKEGITEGVSATEFAPMENLTREQFVTFLYRYAKYQRYDTTVSTKLTGFTDADKVASWALDAMTWAVEKELVNGVTPTTLQPQLEINRAMIAKLLMGMDLKFES